MRLLAWLARWLLHRRLEKAGMDWVKIEHLEVDPPAKRITALLRLEGEAEPVRLVLHYRNDADRLVAERVEVSKPWAQNLAMQWLDDINAQAAKSQAENPAIAKLLRALL